LNEYLFPIQIALITFPLAAYFLTLPFLIVQYRKYSYVNKFRSFILYSLLLYLISAYYLVILPLPTSHLNCVARESITNYMQLTPFAFITNILKETPITWNQPMSFVLLLTGRAFLQVLFNVFLTIPFGVYLRYYFRRRLGITILLSFALSLFFEITQLTGLYGFYKCPYRLFDVDDLMLNTFGGMIGYWIAPIFAAFLPRTDKLDEHIELDKMTVGFIRRGIAFICDIFVIRIIVSTLTIIIRVSAVLVSESSLFAQMEERFLNAVFFVFVIWIYYMIIPSMTGGRTLGKWLTRIQVVADLRRGQQVEVTFIDLFKRYGLLYYGVYGFYMLLRWIADYGDLPDLAAIAVITLQTVYAMVIFIYLLIQLFKRNKILFYEQVSGTRNVISTEDRVKKR
jgi:glycopeptide antibiotics resistance protein